MHIRILFFVMLVWPFIASASSTDNNTPMQHHQHHQLLEQKIKTQLEGEPNNAELWHQLALSLEGQQKYQEAGEAYDKAAALGYQRDWKSQVSLAMLYDSNVVISPSVIDLAAQDRSDISASLQIKLDINAFKQTWGHTAIHLQIDQRQYQNNNSLGLRQLGFELQQFVHNHPDYELLLAVGAQQSTLKKKSLFNAFYFKLNGTYHINKTWSFLLKHQISKRSYQLLYAGFSGTDWVITPAFEVHLKNIHAQIQMSSARRAARILEESYQSNTFMAQISYHIWQSETQEKDMIAWARVKSEGRVYHQLDARPMIRKPRIRQDTESLYVIGLDFNKNKSIFGERSRETWRITGGSHVNISNMTPRVYTNLALSKNWKHWWAGMELIWRY
ncbi:MAG: tetratricopeptide repeat protein [Mariprofundaceae bacterium]|nr:tetratricopeptide repeat protein [Mariprofundaceae bacterium]